MPLSCHSAMRRLWVLSVSAKYLGEGTSPGAADMFRAPFFIFRLTLQFALGCFRSREFNSRPGHFHPTPGTSGSR